MTDQSPRQKKTSTRKKPSQAELKRQTKAQKNRADDAENQLFAMQQQMTKIMDRLEEMDSKPAAHDPKAGMIGNVLNERIDPDLPDRPEAVLPAHLQKISKRLDEQSARNNPVTSSNRLETENEEIGQIEERTMSSSGLARDSLEPIRVVDEGIVVENHTRWTKDKLEHEVFMNEMVCVKVAETTDDTQTPMPEVCVNGRTQFFARGQEQWVKRMFIGPLARAKKTTYTQRMEKLEDGSDTYVQVPHSALMYPFEIVEDNQKGKEWLRSILRES